MVSYKLKHCLQNEVTKGENIMSECINNVTKTLVENISNKTKELKQVTTSLEKMGVFASCTELQRKQHADLLREISISSQSLEQFISISQSI